MTVAAFSVACVAAFIALLSLGWQIAAWRLGGRRVRVVLLHGIRGPHGVVTGKVLRAGKPRDLRQLIQQGFDELEVLGVEVTNVGRVPVTVQSYSAGTTGSVFSFNPVGKHMGPVLPFRIQPGESETWYVDMADVRALVKTVSSVNEEAPRPIAMSVKLGTGQAKTTSTAIRLSI